MAPLDPLAEQEAPAAEEAESPAVWEDAVIEESSTEEADGESAEPEAMALAEEAPEYEEPSSPFGELADPVFGESALDDEDSGPVFSESALDDEDSGPVFGESALPEEPVSEELNLPSDEAGVTPETFDTAIIPPSALAESVGAEGESEEARAWARNLEERLKEFVTGQDTAIEHVAAAMGRAHEREGTGVSPASVMLLGGPQGVGKFRTIKVLTYKLLRSYDGLTVFDMEDNADPGAAARLLGPEGELVRTVQATPLPIVVFNGVQHAHASFFEALLPIISSASLADANGVSVDLSKCLLFLTFDCPAPDFGVHNPESLRDAFRDKAGPEVTGQIETFVPFKLLTVPEIHTIIRFGLRNFYRHLSPHQIGMRVHNTAYEVLVRQGHNAHRGVADLPEVLDRLVFGPAKAMMEVGTVQSGQTIEVVVRDGQMVLNVADDGAPGTA